MARRSASGVDGTASASAPMCARIALGSGHAPCNCLARGFHQLSGIELYLAFLRLLDWSGVSGEEALKVEPAAQMSTVYRLS